MAESYGWIALNRQITSHWIWGNEPFTKAQAWIDLLLHANHKEAKVMLKDQLVTLQRGQQARSQVTLAKEWKWSRDKVKRFLNLLEKDGMLIQQTSQLTSIITICNYKDYQDSKSPDKATGNTTGKQQARQQADSRQGTVKNVNNDNNEKKKEKRAQFSKPELNELQNYCLEKGLNPTEAHQEADKFFNHYEANGWKVGKNPMKKWQAALSGWLTRRKQYEKTKPNGPEELDFNSTGWSNRENPSL